jgi:lysozyme family protein
MRTVLVITSQDGERLTARTTHVPAGRPADVEFGFVDGDLRLFQLRPFLDSKMARGIDYLQKMESRLTDTANITVDREGVPK